METESINDKRYDQSVIREALSSYEDRNSENETSHKNWSQAMRTLEGNFDSSFASAVDSLGKN